MPFQQKTALITGGSRGIGRAVALKLAALGANVAILYAGDEAAAAATVEAARAMGVQAAAHRCDVADHAATGEAAKQVVEQFGGVDILVNNAGITRDNLLLAMPEADFDRVLAVNLKGAYNLTAHLYRQFVRRRSGRIINIASVVGLMGNPGQANYAASKAGLIGFTKSIARELASRGVTCNAIAPGFIESDMTDVLPEAKREQLLGGIPMARLGAPEEVAGVVAFLAGPDAAYLTGQVISVDGGMCM
ncbi:3-oxoacyl-[acyl-carrier-protein] reductase [Ruminococcaceae bacterium OttesenSCG-928-D13]|nr:3-oxoacyl-[acyl-carrier-protein] reductase [Ruminococcaceae bacterium OttesenSCG-928-D13]